MDVSDLIRVIRESTREIIGPQKAVAVAFSGGLDSSVVARIAGEFAEPKCYTAAVRGSHDHVLVEDLLEDGALEVRLLELDVHCLENLVAEAAKILRSTDPVRISYTVPTLRVIDCCEEDLVLVGNGADELFGGYAKYSSMADPTGAMKVDFEKATADIRALQVAASKKTKRLEAPFASDRIRAMAEQMPMSSKIRGTERKVVLREVARDLGLPAHSRPKKAAQYSSGVLKEMRRLAKSGNMDLETWTEKIAQSS